MSDDFETALNLVSTQSPATGYHKRVWLTEMLVKISNITDEPLERVWLLSDEDFDSHLTKKDRLALKEAKRKDTEEIL